MIFLVPIFGSVEIVPSAKYASALVRIALPIAFLLLRRYLSVLSWSPSLSISLSSFPTGSNPPPFAFAVILPFFLSPSYGSPYSVISTDLIFGFWRSSVIFARSANLTYDLPFLSVTLTLYFLVGCSSNCCKYASSISFSSSFFSTNTLYNAFATPSTANSSAPLINFSDIPPDFPNIFSLTAVLSAWLNELFDMYWANAALRSISSLLARYLIS